MGAGRELFGRRKDGTEFPVEIGLNPIETSDGFMVLSSIVDITERHRLDAFQHDQDNIRHRAEQAESRSALLATMSHEIRTPLTGIIGSIDLIRDLELPPRAVDLLSTMLRCSDTLLSIINDILDFSKLEVNQPRNAIMEAGGVEVESIPFQPRQLVADVISILSTQARSKSIQLTYAVNDAVPEMLLGDPARLRQIILNLGSNSLKFTHSGTVTISVTYSTQQENNIQPDDSRIPTSYENSATTADVSSASSGTVLLSSSDGQFLSVEVRDTGVGITPEIQSRLFRPFVQADRSTTRQFGGTGLGLAICLKLARLMKGNISLESKLGVGTSVRFSVLVHPVHNHRQQAEPSSILAPAAVIDTLLPPMLGPHASVGFPRADLPEPSLAPAISADTSPSRNLSPTDLLSTFAKLLPPNGIKSDVLGSSSTISSPTSSATATAVLPVSESRSSASSIALISTTVPRVLLADDDPTNRKILSMYLKKLRCDFECVTNGLEAVNAVQRAPFDLVLMDCEMPVLDGFGATSQMRNLLVESIRSIPIIAMTANALMGDRENCIKHGMDGYLAKPLKLVDLAVCIDSWMKKKIPPVQQHEQQAHLPNQLVL